MRQMRPRRVGVRRNPCRRWWSAGDPFSSRDQRLDASRPLPELEFSSEIPQDLRSLALSQAEFACVKCGAVSGEPDPYETDKQIRLRISCIIEPQDGGANDISNLQAICSICNEGAQNISPKRPDWVDLLVLIRRAPALHQVQALNWLIKKFPKQAGAAIEDQKK